MMLSVPVGALVIIDYHEGFSCEKIMLVSMLFNVIKFLT